MAERLEAAARIAAQPVPLLGGQPYRVWRQKRTKALSLLATHSLLEEDRTTVKADALATKLAGLRKPRRWRVMGTLYVAHFVDVEATTYAEAISVAQGKPERGLQFTGHTAEVIS